MSDLLQLTSNFGRGVARDAWMKLVHAIRTNIEVHHMRAIAPVSRNRIVRQGVPGLAWTVFTPAPAAQQYSLVSCQPFAGIGAQGIGRFNGEVDIDLDALGAPPATGSLIYVSGADGSLGSTLPFVGGLVGRVIDASMWSITNRRVKIVLRFNCVRGI